MKRSFQVLAFVLASFVLAGCNQRAADSGADISHNDNSADPTIEADQGTFAREDLDDRQLPAGLTRDTPPDQIVAAFLSALRSGDGDVGSALLTRRAREETRKRDLTLQEFGAPNARFKVGAPEYLGAHKNGAHVNTAWTEEKDGEVINYDVIWALRLHESGWRVAGMGAQMGPDQPVVYLNFEEPDDMLDKWRKADDIVAAGQTPDPGIRQAQSPSASGTMTR